MVSFSSLKAAVVLNAIIAVRANPDTVNWKDTWLQPYFVGNEWEDSNGVKGHIHNACYGWSGNRGAYQNVYYKPWNQSPYSVQLCVNVGGSHVNFEIANLNPNVGFTLASQDCNQRLSEIVSYTRNGGEYQYAGWWFRADPNAGHC